MTTKRKPPRRLDPNYIAEIRNRAFVHWRPTAIYSFEALNIRLLTIRHRYDALQFLIDFNAAAQRDPTLTINTQESITQLLMIAMDRVISASNSKCNNVRFGYWSAVFVEAVAGIVPLAYSLRYEAHLAPFPKYIKKYEVKR